MRTQSRMLQNHHHNQCMIVGVEQGQQLTIAHKRCDRTREA